MNNRSYMPALLLFIFRFVRLLLSGHQAIAIENALRLQLAAFQRERKRPVLTTFDRVFWITLRPCGPAGAGRCSMSKLTPSSAGNENGFADSGRGYRNVMAAGEAAVLARNSASSQLKPSRHRRRAQCFLGRRAPGHDHGADSGCIAAQLARERPNSPGNLCRLCIPAGCSRLG